MEAMWTFFFPAFVKARELIAAGEIGDVYFCQGDFGIAFPKHITRLWDANLAGGGLLDIGIYPIMAATELLGVSKEDPIDIKAIGSLEMGVDIFGSVTLKYPGNKMAIASWHSIVQTEEETTVVGSKGYIKIHSPAHCSTKITLVRQNARDGPSYETFNFPLPPPAPGCTPFNFMGSNGFQYEAQAVQSYLAAGKTTSDVLPPEVSLKTMGIMDEVRKQIGLKYPFELA